MTFFALRALGLRALTQYTGQVLPATLRGRVSRALALVALLAVAALAWWFWRQKQEPVVLFRRLPGENLLLAYLDLDRLRHATALAPLLRARVEPDPDYEAFVKQTGFDYQRDLDSAAVCYLPDRVYILAAGRFDGARLRQYALAQGGSCAGPGLQQPCRMPASRPDRKISFFLLSPRILALATAPEPDAVLQLESSKAPSAEPLAKAAAGISGSSALLWATATPASLDRLLSGPPSLSPNLLLFSKTVAGAQRVYLSATDQSPNLEISLKAVCNSEAQAGEMRRLLQGLTDLTASLMRGARGAKPPGEWESVLASAVIDQRQNTVRAAWILDQTVLRSLGNPEAAR